MVAAAFCVCAQTAHAQVTACRQALVLGLDVSASVDSNEYRLQLEGLARALTSEAVSRRILDGAEVPVSLYVFEWSGPDVQRTILDWVAITNAGVLSSAAATISDHARDPVGDTIDHSTSVATAIEHGIAAIGRQSQCWKRTIDISGDGKHNTGGDPRNTHPTLAAAAITVNGLVVGVDSPRGGDIRQLEIGELSSYYHAHVIFGPGAFVETALGFSDFERAMKRKLLRELQGPVFGAIEGR
ncbi:MAG: DUF1194 domain-containing protein [Pseudomonadota bacterium]